MDDNVFWLRDSDDIDDEEDTVNAYNSSEDEIDVHGSQINTTKKIDVMMTTRKTAI